RRCERRCAVIRIICAFPPGRVAVLNAPRQNWRTPFMDNLGPVRSEYGIEHHGITNVARAYWNLSTSALVEEAVRRGEGLLSADGALVVTTGKHTGRSPNDKFIVEEPTSKDKINWGKVNKPIDPDKFDRLHARMLAYFQNRDVFVVEAQGGAAASLGL